MKKKGFTLVELLAVIAILAILVIIALPNVMGMFNQAKHNSFNTEVKNILKQAGQQWVTDGSMNSTTGALCYSRKPQTGSPVFIKELLLSGRSNLDYAVCINKAGKITSFAATDQTYVVYYSGTAGLAPEDVSVGTGAYTAGHDDGSPAKGVASSYVITDSKNASNNTASGATIGKTTVTGGTCNNTNYTGCKVTLTLN